MFNLCQSKNPAVRKQIDQGTHDVFYHVDQQHKQLMI